MITIKYADRNRMVDRWVSVFEEVVLSHQLVRDTKLAEPILTSGREEIRGEKAISLYVNRLKHDVVTDWASW
ncbi:MAG: hypothetical protein HEP71_10630 [Roseivirga sp.]|nr:hypothetical protein [Roseivirga sp.]